MKALLIIRRILALAVAIWALGVTVFFLFFARESFESTTASSTSGGIPVTTTTSGQIPWITQAGPFSVAVMLTFSLLLATSAWALWRGALALAIPLSFLSLAAAFITGFSIGGLYFPGAAGAFLGMCFLSIEKLLSRFNRPNLS
jgi:hypothetical protein